MAVKAPQCTHGSTPARFIGLTCGPNSMPDAAPRASRNTIDIKTGRKYFQRVARPITGTSRRSNLPPAWVGTLLPDRSQDAPRAVAKDTARQ